MVVCWVACKQVIVCRVAHKPIVEIPNVVHLVVDKNSSPYLLIGGHLSLSVSVAQYTTQYKHHDDSQNKNTSSYGNGNYS